MRTLPIFQLQVAFAFLLTLTAVDAGDVSGTLGANTTWSDTTSDYVIDNFSGPLVVPAGITLTVSPDVAIRVKYNNKPALEVRGTMVAQSAVLDLRTSNSAAGGKTAARVLGDGMLDFTDCHVTGVHEGTFAEDSRLIELAGASRGTFRGTRFITGSSGTALANAILVSGTATLECLASTGGGQGGFTGFRKPVLVTSTTAATVSHVAFEDFVTALDFSGADAAVENCSFMGKAESRGVVFAGSAKNLLVRQCAFTGGPSAVVFNSAGGDLTIEASTFTGCEKAVEAVRVDAFTFDGSTIAGTAEAKGQIGLHLIAMSAFAATGSAIQWQETGILLPHANRGIDVSGVQFSDNDQDVYSSGDYTFPSNILEDMELLPGRYVINGSTSIEEGVTLTLQPGVIVVSETGGAAVFYVKGRFVANGIRFEFSSPHAGGVIAEQQGEVEVTGCTFVANNGGDQRIMIAGINQSRVTVTSCIFEAQPASVHRPASAFSFTDDSVGVITGTAEAPTIVRGFPVGVDWQSTQNLSVQHTLWQDNTVGLHCRTDANLVLSESTFTQNDAAIYLERFAGAWRVEEVMIETNGRGLDFGAQWQNAELERGGFSFVDNTADLVLRTKGALLTGDVTLSSGEYVVDCDGNSPAVIAVGGRLMVGPGTTIRTFDPTEGPPPGGGGWGASFYFLRVEGLFLAEGAEMELRTFSAQGDSIDVAGNGEARLRGCTIRSGDRSRQIYDWNGQKPPDQPMTDVVFRVRDQGRLTLAGSTVFTEESEEPGDAMWRVGNGIVASDDAVVVLESLDGRVTELLGFSQMGIDLSGRAALTASGARVRDSGVGLDGSGGATLTAQDVEITDCGVGLRWVSTETAIVADIILANCERALDTGGALLGFDRSGITFIDNTVDHPVRAGFALSESITLQAGRYHFDLVDGPLTIPAGTRLTLPEGCVITAYNSRPHALDKLFVVEGELVATSCEIRMFDLDGGGGLRSPTHSVFRGNGRGEFTDCRFQGDDPGGGDSVFILVEGDASLAIRGGELFRSGGGSAFPFPAIAHRSTGSLALEDSLIMGFKVGLRMETMPSVYEVKGNRFIGNTEFAVLNLANQEFDGTDNWWGHPTGPRHPTNPLALGDPVSDRVRFLPYVGQVDLAALVLVDHPAGAASNALAGGAGAVNAVAFRFGLRSEDVLRSSGLTLELLEREGVQESNFRDWRLVNDSDGNGVWDTGSEPVLAIGEVQWTEGKIRFSGNLAGNGDFLIVATFADVPGGAAMKIRLGVGGVNVDLGQFVAGAAHDSVHFRDRVILADHAALTYGDALTGMETQRGVILSGFSLGAGAAVREFRFDLASVVGLEVRQFSAVELVTDTNGDGLAGDLEPRLRGGIVAINGSVGAITFMAADQPVVSGGSYLLRADLSGLRAGSALTISMARAGVVPVEPETALSGSVRAARHVVEAPLFVLDAAFQVRNDFVESEQLPRRHLLGFTFAPLGRPVQGMVFRFPEVSGIHAWEVTNARLYRDDNSNGVIEAGETVTVGGTGLVEIDEANHTGSIRFDLPFTAQGTYILVADVAHLDKGDALTVELHSDDVDAGAGILVDGGVSPVHHFVPRPGLAASPLQQNWTLTWRSPGGLEVCGGYSRDGRKAVIGYNSGAAYVYDLESGAPELMLMRHYDKVRYAGFSGDDSQIITVTRDGGVFIRNAATGELERQLFADVLVQKAAPSPDFTRLLVVTEGRRAFLLSLLEERQLWEFTVNSDVHSVDFSPDGTRVLLGCADKRAYVLDAETGAVPKVVLRGITYDLIFQGHHDSVNGVAFTGDGTRIMTASRDATVTLWHAQDPVNPIATVSLSGEQCQAAWVNRAGNRVAMVTENRRLRMYDDEGLEVYSYALPPDLYTGTLAIGGFSDDGSEFMVGSNGGSGSVVTRYRTDNRAFIDTVGPIGLVSGNLNSPVRMSGDGRRIFFMKDRGLEIMQRQMGAPIRRYSELSASYPYDITPDGSKLAWTSDAFRLAVVDDDRLTPISSSVLGLGGSQLSLSKSGGLAISGDKIYRTASGALYADSPNPDGGYPNAFSPDNELWGIAVANSIKTMRTTDASAGLEYAVTLTTGMGTAHRVLYHPDGIRVGGVFNSGIQFYRLDNNLPVGVYDNRGDGVFDARLSNDGSMLLVARANSARLYDMRTARPLRYFYPLHSGQANCNVRAIAFGERDDIIMIAWSDNYVETYERTRLRDVAITPATRTMPPTTSQEFVIEAIYDDGSRLDVSPRAYRTESSHTATAVLTADPPDAVEIEGNRVTVAPQAAGTISLTAAYSEGGVTRTATATITVGPSPLVSLIPNELEVTLSPGVVLPMSFTAVYADGYREVVDAELTLDAPQFARLAGNNLTILRSAGTRTLTVTGTFTIRGVTRSATMRIVTHGQESNWTRSQVTSGGDILAMDYRPDGLQLAAGSSSGAISLYAVGASPTAYELEAVIPAHERPVRNLFYRSNGELVSVGEDGWIRSWSLANPGRPVREFAHDAAITCAAYTEGWLVFGDNLGRVQALSLDQNRLAWSQPVHSKAVRGVAIDADSVFSGGDDRKAALLRRIDGGSIINYPGYSAPVVAVGFRNGMTYTISEDRRLVEWVKGTVDEAIWENFLPGLPTAVEQTSDRLFLSISSPKTSVEDGESTVTGVGSTTWIYNNDGLLLHQLEHSPAAGKVSALALSPGGDFLLTGRSTGEFTVATKNGTRSIVSSFHSVQFWDAARGSYRGSLDHNESIEAARITQDGAWLFTQSKGRVFRWGLENGLERTKFLETGYDVPYRFSGLRLSGDEAGTMVTRVDETMYLMDAAQRLLRMSVHQAGASLYDISSDGRRLISYGGNLRLWDVSLDFPTVLYETSEKPASNLAFFPSCLPERQGDWVAGLPDGSQLFYEPFLAVFNDRGLQFSGITLPVESSSGLDLASWTERIAVSRNQSRIAVVAQPGAVGMELPPPIIYVLELCSPTTGIGPRLLRIVECDAPGRVAVALSDDGSLLFYGVPGNSATAGILLEVDTGRRVYTFSPPSAGTLSYRGPADAQFTRNDGALMIAWAEGYSAIYTRQGFDRLEIAPAERTVSPGEQLALSATAVYVDGTRMDVTDEVRWALATTPQASLQGSSILISQTASPGSTLQVRASHEILGVSRQSTSTLNVGAPRFVELVADPARVTLTAGSEVTFQYFARMADQTTRAVTGVTTLSADPVERVIIEGTRVQIPPLTQPGYISIQARTVFEGDERTVSSVIRVLDPSEAVDPGDFDGDGQVGFADVLHLVGLYGETTNSPRWDARGDLNGNGRIDFADVLALVGIYGTEYGRTSRNVGQLSAIPYSPSDPVAFLRVEGPVEPVRVGETFDVRIYAKETDADAEGVTGVQVDVLYDLGLVRQVQPFEPRLAVEGPYNSIVTEGREFSQGVEGLGGVCLAPGQGDDEEVLFATLRLVATRPGMASFRLAAGDGGVALTRPLGLLSADRIDYGSAWQVSVVEDGFVGRLEVSVDSLRQTLRFGVRDGASPGFDPWEGDAEGLPPGEQGQGAWLMLGGQGLAADVRPAIPGQVWRLQLVAPPMIGHSTVSLSWMGTEAPPGTALFLVPADPGGNPLSGRRYSLGYDGQVSIPSTALNSGSLDFLIVWDRLIAQTWRLEPGWNLVGCEIEPDERTSAEVLSHPGLRAVLEWTTGFGYSIPEGLDSQRGYLVYARDQMEVVLEGIPRLGGTQVLTSGWNLVSEHVRAALGTDVLAAPGPDGGGRAAPVGQTVSSASWVFIDESPSVKAIPGGGE